MVQKRARMTQRRGQQLQVFFLLFCFNLSILPLFSQTSAPKPVSTKYSIEELLNGQDIKDYTPFKEDRTYTNLLYDLRGISEKTFTKKSTSFSYDLLMKSPSSARGRFIHIEGVLIYFNIFRLKNNSSSGLEDVYEGILIDQQKGNPYFFQVLEKPRFKPELRQSLVSVDGLFVQVLTYPNQQGKNMAVPFILGKRIIPLLPQVTPAGDGTRVETSLFILALFIMMVGFLWVRRRRRNRSLLQEQLKVIQEKYKRKRNEER